MKNKKKIKRINFYSGPGGGKSTMAAWLFSELKTQGINVEYVTEFVKAWAYQQRKIEEFDQVYLFGCQMNEEQKFLRNGVGHIITDSPTMLGAMYAEHYAPELGISDSLLTINKSYETLYPSYNIFLERGEKSYRSLGRFQTEDEAKQIDDIAWDLLTNNLPHDQIVRIPYNDREQVLEKTLKIINS